MESSSREAILRAEALPEVSEDQVLKSPVSPEGAEWEPMERKGVPGGGS